MKRTKDISSPKIGMNRSTHPTLLKANEYPFAMNINNTTEEGDRLNITNEPSNLLAVEDFIEGYKIIGYKYDNLLEKTFYFLTNPTTGYSSFGYVNNITNIDEIEDQLKSCGTCGGDYKELGQPLEILTQIPHQEYVELLNDDCNKEFNFNITHPIKTIEIKKEKLGTTIYFTDDYNPPRYINIDNIDIYKVTGEIICGEGGLDETCLDSEKLLMFPHHSTPTVNAEVLQTGGNLPIGVYEFYVAYSDYLGNELTDYATPTNPISIFDENNYLLIQPELAQLTNFAIRLKVNDLDTRFKYYKVIVKEVANIFAVASYFVEGIHPTTDDTIIYSSSAGKERAAIDRLYVKKPIYETSKGLVASNNILFQYGLKTKRVPNLQPVVNLFGGLLRWQTSIAKEGLYKSAIATSKHKGYAREEVQPFAIRFFSKDGSYTPNFPLVARPISTTQYSEDGETYSTVSEDLVLDSENDLNLKSLEDNTPNCISSGRNKLWQVYNTAKVLEECTTLNSIVQTSEDVKKSCSISNVYTVPTGTTTISPVPVDYTTFEQYLIDYKSNVTDSSDPRYISEIATALNDTYTDTCTPDFSNCDTPTLKSEVNFVSDVVGDVENTIYKAEADYKKTVASSLCSQYLVDASTGNRIHDTNFETNFMPPSSNVYLRNSNFENEDCSKAIDILDNNPININTGGYFNNYYGGAALIDILTSKDAFVTGTGFDTKISKGALWYKVQRNSRDQFVFEITQNSSCNINTTDSISDSTLNKLRYTFFATCSSSTPLGGAIIDTTIGDLKVLSTLTGYPSDEFYVAIDAPYKTEVVSAVTKYRTAPPCGCYNVFTRDVEIKSVTVTWDSVVIGKQQTYESTCHYAIPQVDDCDPQPYKNGEFAYFESTERYPNNSELYDSSSLKITSDSLATLSAIDKQRFVTYYTNGAGINPNTGIYTLKDADLTCQPIRHFKMPSNDVTPFMSTFDLPNFSENYIFPLGVSLDSNVVNAMLQVAVDNGLLSQKELSEIDGYEILRGDTSVQKSIIASGLAYDMYKYTEKDKSVLYANYPHNDLGQDLLHYTDKNRSTLIQHPFGGSGNNKFSFISPDLFLGVPIIGSEIIFSGYQMGNSKGYFSEVKKHPKWTILSSKAKTTAIALGTAEALLEVILKTSELIVNGTGQAWVVGGVSTGGSIGTPLSSAAIIAYTVAAAASGFVSAGKYSYDWQKIIRDLGQPINNAEYYVSEGFHNKFLKNSDITSYSRGISASKLIKDGKFSFTDEKTGESLKINNFKREYSEFISFGNHSITYDPTYKDYDNNSNSSSLGSRVISSQVGCDGSEVVRNVGSPYFTLKNYISNQYGTIDSIKWLTTNYKRKLTDNTICDPIFGGTVSISRFTWKRKIPIFNTTSMGEPDKLPFNYSFYPNIGNPRFYCDYEKGADDVKILGAIFPTINSEYNFDCLTTSTFYVRKPSKFYLYYYGIANFLVESEINCNFRYGKKELFNQFYPQVGDMIDWTQEANVPISEPNTFFYNTAYSLPVSNTPFTILDRTYSSEVAEKRRDEQNAVIYSEQDNSENDLVNPWLIYKPLNRYEFPKKYGRLIHLKDLESAQVLGRFENQQVLFNAIDTVQKTTNMTITQIVGEGGIFAQRPLEFKATDLGFAGSQNTDMVSTPYGHFTVDAKRGEVFSLDSSGKDLQLISEIIGGKESGMKNWFKNNLPFRMLKYIPDADIDNKYLGIGLSMGYDNKYGRVFITKKDFIPKNTCITFDREKGFIYNKTACESTDQIPTCPEGYTYNSLTNKCERLVNTSICPEGYVYDDTFGTCTKIDVIDLTIPVLTATDYSLTIQSGDTLNIGLSSSVPDTIISWTSSTSDSTGNTNNTGTTITDTLVADAGGTVVYTVNGSTFDGCSAEPITITVTIESAGIPCGGSLSVSTSGAGYREVDVVAGTEIGSITVTLDAFGVPDRFQIIWDGNIVADSLFIGDGLPDTAFENNIIAATSLDKYKYDGIDFVLNGTLPVDYSASDIANSTGSGGTLRSSGSVGAQIGVVANYPSPTAKASDGNIQLTFNKTTPLPAIITIVGISVESGTNWDIISVSCPA